MAACTGCLDPFPGVPAPFSGSLVAFSGSLVAFSGTAPTPPNGTGVAAPLASKSGPIRCDQRSSFASRLTSASAFGLFSWAGVCCVTTGVEGVAASAGGASTSLAFTGSASGARSAPPRDRSSRYGSIRLIRCSSESRCILISIEFISSRANVASSRDVSSTRTTGSASSASSASFGVGSCSSTVPSPSDSANTSGPLASTSSGIVLAHISSFSEIGISGTPSTSITIDRVRSSAARGVADVTKECASRNPSAPDRQQIASSPS